jgi:hypothetical protein
MIAIPSERKTSSKPALNAVAVANEVARRRLLPGQRQEQVARLLHNPGAVGVA